MLAKVNIYICSLDGGHTGWRHHVNKGLHNTMDNMGNLHVTKRDAVKLPAFEPKNVALAILKVNTYLVHVCVTSVSVTCRGG